MLALYPVVKELTKRAPQAKQWIEKKAKKNDPFLLLYLEMMQGRDNYLVGSILSAMFSQPKFDRGECSCPIYWAITPDESGNYKSMEAARSVAAAAQAVQF